MNPMLDPETERQYDQMIIELDNAGYEITGQYVKAPDGYKFFLQYNCPFYLAVYKAYDDYKYRLHKQSQF
jgi:hypothetical protein